MKKQLVTLSASILFFLPLYLYAEETPSTVLGIASTTKEVKEDAALTASTAPVRTFTVCSQEAIEARDTKIASSRVTYNLAMANALTERKNREKAAVAITDGDNKKSAVKASIDTYKHQAKTTQTTLTQARKLAWQTFDNDIKACRDLEQVVEEQTLTSIKNDDENREPAAKMMMRKAIEEGDTKDQKAQETKSFRDTIKDKFESIKSLFN